MLSRILGLLVLVSLLAFTLSSCNNAQGEPKSVLVTLSWTAPGDDGIMGNASAYELKYAETVDSLVSNWANCSTIPTGVPVASGQADSVVVNLTLQTEKTYYFAIKAADEVPNWSDLSNVVSLYVADTEAPIEITDLKIK